MVRIIIDTEADQDGWKQIGEVSVDTGRLIIADPCYLDGLKENPSELAGAIIQTDLLGLCDSVGENFDTLRQDPDAMARVLAQRKIFGEAKFPGGDAVFVASETGYGDGRYPVFSKVEDGRVVGIWIDFECGEHWPDDEEE